MRTVSVRSAIQNSVPISNFNKGMAGKIFSDVRATGPKVVIKNKENNKGKIEIDYGSREEFERIMELIEKK